MNAQAHIQTGKRKPQVRRNRLFLLLIASIFLIPSTFVAPAFQTPAYAVDTPVLLTPADGVIITAKAEGFGEAHPPVAIPEFSWQAVSGATYYRVEISQDIGFSSIPFARTTPLTRFIPPYLGEGPLSDGLWYWRVRVEAPVAGTFSTARSFTKQWASPNNKPLLISPANSATVEYFDAPSFSWAPVIGAAYYRFQIATSPAFTTIVSDQYPITTTYQPESKLPNATYYWRVIPIDPSSRTGTSSESRMFVMGYNQIPTLLEPANNSTPTFTPTFRWTAVRGAQFYMLQYSTDPSFNSGLIQVNSQNTTYSPPVTLENDRNYYWRVRTYSGNSVSDWSPVWRFTKQWYIQPVLLTPVDGYQHVRFPIFTWTPVPGASFYRFELDTNQDFVNNYITEDTSNNFYTPNNYEGIGRIMYWRVTPYDANSRRGKESGVFSYYSEYTKVSPDLIYPYYYYTPNTFPAPDENVVMNPYVDRTVSWPIFYWHRLTTPFPVGGTYAYAYRLQVSTSSLFNPIAWTVDTQNTHASPTVANNFVPVAGQDYFWRVRALNSSGVEVGNWSQIWKTHITIPAAGSLPPPPQLRRPVNAAEFVETTPSFEWRQVAGADSYEVQISNDSGFASVLDTGIVKYPAYSPTASLAQRLLSKINYGTYYWRVRARAGGNPLGDWSEIRRFQVASQSERKTTARTPGDAANQLLIGSDPDDTADNNYELTTLNAVQDSNYWYFGFNATAAVGNMSYAMYLDVDHLDNSGATFDPRGYTVTTIPAHRPEYAIFINQVGATFTVTDTEVYKWNGTVWGSPQRLSDIGGGLTYNAGGGYVEIKAPNTSIGMRDDTGSYAVALFSLPAVSGLPVDSVPTNPNVPGNGLLNRFASVSERMNLVMPPNNADGDLNDAYPFVPPFYFDYPTGSNGTAPWAGVRIRVFLDPGFTTQVAEYTVVSNSNYFAGTSHHWYYDLQGDNTYFWRAQPCYNGGCQVFGAWTQGWRFERRGLVPQNLQESVTFATPNFSWDMVEGANNYDLQVDNDPNYGSLEIGARVAQNSYTPQNTLNSGVYYWRVRVVRFNNALAEWSASKSFTLAYPLPAGLTPNDPDPNHTVKTTPTFCWTPLIQSVNSIPVLAAYRYRLQVSKGDPTFSVPLFTIETEQSCYTPLNGFEDGTYYWRVSMIDGNYIAGAYSPAAVFTKQYPAAKPLSPVNGSTSSQTPTFIWTADDGVTPYVFGAAAYKIEISQFPTFTPIYDGLITNNTRYTPTRLYDTEKTYYWRVAIVDKDSRVGPFNDAVIIINPYSNRVYLPFLRK